MTTKLEFGGADGKKPSAQARRYIYRIIAAMIHDDVKDPEGWLLAGLTQEPDRRRVVKQAALVAAEMMRKGSR